MPSVGGTQHTFARVPNVAIQRSSFNRSFAVKTTFDASYLTPIFVDLALPGDTYVVRMNAQGRLSTPIKPIMDNIMLDTFFFAVPIRLVWDNFVKFMGEQKNPADSIAYTVPKFTAHIPVAEGLSDYMGIPCAPFVTGNIEYSSLWHRAYALIWNEWFRDQNFQNSITVPLGDGPDAIADLGTVLRRGKRHDYFTSCLPWLQKGTAVSLPLGVTAPVIPASGTAHPLFKNTAGGVSGGNLQAAATGDTVGVNVASPVGNWTAADFLQWDTSGLVTNLAGATAATINQLRQAFQIQRFLERDARGGTRYTEKVKAQFGVTSPDARLQRPEYLGGGSAVVHISPVAQTSSTGTQATPPGNLTAIGTASWQGGRHGFTKSFTEHCLLIGLIAGRADITYQQGLNRMFSYSTQYDFPWPAFANIGEQAVLSKEIYMKGHADDELVFGYQERYGECRYKPSYVTGRFRSAHATSLDVWHLAEDYTSRPVLGATWIVDNPDIDRVIAVPTEPHFILDAWFECKTARPLPLFGVPGMIDHF